MVEKDIDIDIDHSTPDVFTKEEQYKFMEHLRSRAYGVASHYEGEKGRLRRAALRGLIDAMRLYKKEYAKKYKFSTYATWFMKESVEKEVGFKEKKADA